MLFALVQVAIASTPTSLIGPYIVSGGAVFTGAVALAKVSFVAGRFEEWKETMNKREADRKLGDSEVVKRHEIEVLGTHIDKRLDDISRQISELRAIKLGGSHG